MMVLYPTSTPATSVIALYLPGVPLKGIPISLARGFCAKVIQVTKLSAMIGIMNLVRLKRIQLRISVLNIITNKPVLNKKGENPGKEKYYLWLPGVNIASTVNVQIPV